MNSEAVLGVWGYEITSIEHSEGAVRIQAPLVRPAPTPSAQAKIDAFIEGLNGERRHYIPSPRLYTGIPEPHYPFHHRTVVVTSCGRLCLYRKKINLSVRLAGQAVGVKEVDNGIWLVSFMDYDLGYIDLEEKTLQSLENPFGPKVLPTS